MCSSIRYCDKSTSWGVLEHVYTNVARGEKKGTLERKVRRDKGKEDRREDSSFVFYPKREEIRENEKKKMARVMLNLTTRAAFSLI